MSEERPPGPDPIEEVYDRISDAVFALDEDWRFTFLNDEAERLLQRERDDLVGKNVWEEFPEAVDSTFQHEYERAMETQKPVSFEEYYAPLETWFEVRAYPSPTGLSVYFHDVTDRVHQRTELQDRERTLRRTYRVIGDPARSTAEKIRDLLELGRKTLDAEVGLLSHVREESDRYVVEALSAPASIGVETGDVLQLEVVPCCMEAYRAGRTLALSDVETQAPGLVHPELGVASYLGAPVEVDGDAYGTFCFFDLSPRSEPWTDWEETYVSLLGRWTSSELERERRAQELERSNERLAASNRRLERFTRAASHDLREPSRTIANQLQLLQERYADDLSADANTLVDFALRGALQMNELVRGLVAYARIETHPTDVEPVDLEAVVEDVLKAQAGQLEDSGAEVEVGALPRVAGDAEQLRELFANLVENAIRFSGDETPRIEIEAEREDDRWRVAVHDAGVGIEAAYRERLLAPFERLHSSQEKPGAGLGLAICQRIAERHGGHIEIESEAGQGSTFTFTLPSVEDGEPVGGEGSLLAKS